MSMSAVSEYFEGIQGRLGIIAMRGCEEFAKKVSDQIVEIREKMGDTEIIGYHRDSYLLDAAFPRFSTGEIIIVFSGVNLMSLFWLFARALII